MIKREPDDLDAAQLTLRDAIQILHRTTESFASNPQPVLDTAAELVRRGDPADATLR